MPSYLHIIQAFSLSLTNAKSVEDVCWELTKNVIAHMDFEDCVVYLYDENRKVLVQVAAHGPKNPVDLDIYNPITIQPGEGIVGSVYLSGQPEIIPNTAIDWRYIVDDQRRLSEICVPILHQGQAIGVIDSEHSQRDFYTADHLLILNTLASIASNKIIKTRAFEELEKVNNALRIQEQNTELQNAELRRLNKQLDELVYRLSHDFRTPVIGVLGLLDVLQQDPTKISLFIDNLRGNMQRLDRILQNIYFYSLNLRKPIETEAANLSDLFEDVYRQLNHPNKEIATLHVADKFNKPFVCDTARLKIFARHVLQNSLHFGIPPNKTDEMKIEIQIAQAGNSLKLRFSDNGPGLPEEFRVLTQTMFNRGSLLSEGAGLGFFLCKEIAHKLNGTLQIESERGLGTHHILEIPL